MGPGPGMFRALIERCPMVSYVCDEANRITYISPQIEAWTGLPAQLWVDDPSHWHDMLHPDDRDRVVNADFGDGTLDIEYRALAGPRGGDDPSRPLHPACGGHGPDHPDRRLGPRGALPAGAEWTAMGLRPRLAFNASPRELRGTHHVDRVAGALARSGMQPEQLLIEVRESPMYEADRTQCVIERLHRLGVTLALDDFGTEHSSLSRLRALPVQVLKVDRSFLRDVPGDAASEGIVRSIVTLGAGLGMDIVAEGIETDERLRFAAGAGCGFGQGHHFARPLPAAEITPLLERSLASRRRDPAAIRAA